MSEENTSDGLKNEQKKRGRPRKIDKDIVVNALTKFKKRISPNKDGHVVSKNNSVWEEIAKEVNHVKSAGAMYTYVVCNQDGVRSLLCKNFKSFSHSDDCEMEMNQSLLENSTLHSITEVDSAFHFTINITASQFDQLVESRIIYLNKKQPRNVKKFRKGEWQQYITAKIWESTRLKCAYNFRHHHLNTECTSGTISGQCRCGSKISCIIERNEYDVVAIHCSTTASLNDQECGKRYVRGSTRAKLGEKLQAKSAHVLRCEMANGMMDNGDFEPPHLPLTNVMRTIKSQNAASHYLHPNPIVALEILSTPEMEQEIPWIGHKPFFVHYSTNHQRTIYRTACEGKHISLAIDAIGSIIIPITRVDKTKSGPIFLYVAVLTTSSSPLSIAQMLSERQTTGAIHFWLTQWIEQWALTPPDEIICDASITLLSSAVRAFTIKNTINQYADQFFTNDLPACYIRIDVAHFIKSWANLMRDVRFEVGKFYKVAIGKLVLYRKIDDAERIVRAVLTIARSKNDGETEDGRMSACDKQKAFMKQVITTNILEELDLDDEWNEEQENDEGVEADGAVRSVPSRAEPSKWREWGKTIDSTILKDIKKAPGTNVNAHWLPLFADRLIDQLKWLPLWSCIMRDRYGYGRCPPSSAHVEAEFRIIKNLLLKDMNARVRPDIFVQKHKKYIDGICKLDEAQMVIEREQRRRKPIQNGERNNNHSPVTFEHSENAATPDCNDHTLDSVFGTPAYSSSIVDISAQGMDTALQCIEITPPKMNCPACQNGHFPGGAHRCIICRRAVHIFDTCSLPITNSEEGYGEKRICVDCSEKPNAHDLIESGAYENWRNQAKEFEDKRARGATGIVVRSPTTRRKRQKSCVQNLANKQDENGNKENVAKNLNEDQRGKFLQETYPAHEFILTKELSSVPILKSGDETTLKPIRKGEQRIDLTHTCAFDSFFQMMLTAAFDSKFFFLNTIKVNVSISEFFKMIYDVHEKKITIATYRKRSDILCKYFEKHGHPEVNCVLIDCKSTIAGMCRKLLKDLPCFEETSVCTAKCAPSSKRFPLLTISARSLTASSHNIKIEEEIIVDRYRECPSEGCIGEIRTGLKVTGDFVIFEVMMGDDNGNIKLKQIPTKLKLSFMAKEFYLRGIIHFDEPRLLRNVAKVSGLNDPIGHYTAFYLRNGKWVQFDKKIKSRTAISSVSPQLVMYST